MILQEKLVILDGYDAMMTIQGDIWSKIVRISKGLNTVKIRLDNFG